MTDAPEAQETADEVARTVERVRTMDAVRATADLPWAIGLLEKRRAELALHHQRFPYTIDKSMAETAIAIEFVQHALSRLAVLEEERRLDGAAFRLLLDDPGDDQAAGETYADGWNAACSIAAMIARARLQARAT